MDIQDDQVDMFRAPKSIGDLMKGHLPKKKPRSERAILIEYFQERAVGKNNKPFSHAKINMMLSYCSVQDLYAFKSMLEDRARTFKPYKGQDGKMVLSFNWNKTFFGMIKSKETNWDHPPF